MIFSQTNTESGDEGDKKSKKKAKGQTMSRNKSSSALKNEETDKVFCPMK